MSLRQKTTNVSTAEKRKIGAILLAPPAEALFLPSKRRSFSLLVELETKARPSVWPSWATKPAPAIRVYAKRLINFLTKVTCPIISTLHAGP
jgi:hypothetical protein